jgi:hypothetical protein
MPLIIAGYLISIAYMMVFPRPGTSLPVEPPAPSLTDRQRNLIAMAFDRLSTRELFTLAEKHPEADSRPGEPACLYRR